VLESAQQNTELACKRDLPKCIGTQKLQASFAIRLPKLGLFPKRDQTLSESLLWGGKRKQAPWISQSLSQKNPSKRGLFSLKRNLAIQLTDFDFRFLVLILFVASLIRRWNFKIREQFRCKLRPYELNNPAFKISLYRFVGLFCTSALQKCPPKLPVTIAATPYSIQPSPPQQQRTDQRGK